MTPFTTTFFTGLLLIVALGCGAPDGGRAGGQGRTGPEGSSPSGEVAGQHEEAARAAVVERTRAQFEAARHGQPVHASSGCPLCADPLAGRLPPEALLDGPAEVWN